MPSFRMISSIFNGYPMESIPIENPGEPLYLEEIIPDGPSRPFARPVKTEAPFSVVIG
jgi:hypothetical protein